MKKIAFTLPANERRGANVGANNRLARTILLTDIGFLHHKNRASQFCLQNAAVVCVYLYFRVPHRQLGANAIGADFPSKVTAAML